jgi:hypothetical protein
MTPASRTRQASARFLRGWLPACAHSGHMSAPARADTCRPHCWHLILRPLTLLAPHHTAGTSSRCWPLITLLPLTLLAAHPAPPCPAAPPQLEGNISDSLQSRFSPGTSVPQLCSALEKAALDPRVVGICFEVSTQGGGHLLRGESRTGPGRAGTAALHTGPVPLCASLLTHARQHTCAH